MASLVVIGTLGVAPPVTATSVSLCRSIAACQEAGFGDAGYAAARSRANWAMTPGVTCTNYVGFRLSSGGRVTARPPGATTAGTWGGAAKALGIPVDAFPSRGAVAWWGAGVAPAGPKGHVAYVEMVLPDGSFYVSEDSFGGDFGWRRVYPVAQGWPSGFIRFPQSDGSPVGRLTSIRSPQRKTLDLWAWGADPDAMGASQKVLVTVGGSRHSPHARRYTTSTPYFRFHRIIRSRAMPSGRRSVHVYLVNHVGTGGNHYVWLGRRTVRIR